MFYHLFNFDIKTMVGILFWGNLTSALLILSYQAIHKSDYDIEYVRILYFSRFIKSIYYFMIFLSGIIPDIISVNFGNTLMYISLYMDGYLMLKLSRLSSRMVYYLLKSILVCSIVIFNLTDIFYQNSDLRVSLTSLFMFAILLLPSLTLVFTRKNSRFSKIVGLFYIMLLASVISRAIYSFAIDAIYIFTNNFIQSLTFLTLILIMIFSAPAFLLVMKENTNKLIEKIAKTDGLTKIQNRQSFMDAAQQCFERHKKLNLELTMLFFDIDFFKKVNDVYGHPFGDEVLVKLAEIIKCNMRSNDLSCRYGGEEFLALLPGSGEDTGTFVSNRIMQEIRELHFDIHPEFKFTISIGLCTGIPVSEDTLSTFINKADKALYEAKNTGRNKVVIYRDSL